jgi:galactokinase
MDQMASMHGLADHLVFLDTRSLVVEHVPFDLSTSGLVLLVVDTRAPHRLTDGAYAQRRSTCERSAAALGLAALRDVTDLDAALAALPDAVQRRRVRHVVTENRRVLDVTQRLCDGSDPRRIGDLLTASHTSLRDDYEVSVPELDLAVDTALGAGAYGARMTGGGFGGSVIALVDSDAVLDVQAAVTDAFAAAGFAEPAPFTARPADGARRLA